MKKKKKSSLGELGLERSRRARASLKAQRAVLEVLTDYPPTGPHIGNMS
jgi:hypothetical protein